MGQRGQVQLQHRPRQARQPQQGSSSNSEVHRQARQPRAATEECRNSGALRLTRIIAPAAVVAAGAANASSVEAKAPAPISETSAAAATATTQVASASDAFCETGAHRLVCSISRCGRQGDIAAGGYKTNDLSSSSSSSTCDCIGICSSGSCNNRCHLGCVVGGEASCEAGTYRLEWRPIRRSSNTSCIVGSGDSSFDPGVHCLERRRRCVASADAGGGDSAERGVAWTGSAATLAVSGAAAAASHAE